MARRRKRPLIPPVIQPNSSSGGGSRGGLVDQTSPSVKPHTASSVGAGLSAPNWTPDAKPKAELSVPDAFVAAIISGDREQIKAAWAKMPSGWTQPAAAAAAGTAIKARFVSMPTDQRAAVVKTVGANKDIFGAVPFKMFRDMMQSAPPAPKDAKPLNFEAVGLEGSAALNAVNQLGHAVPHSDADVTALADMAYREARGEGVDGMRGVLHVAVNRQEEAGSRWANKPLTAIVGSSEFAQGAVNRDSPEWKQAFALAQSVVTGEDSDPTHGATYFANPKTSDPAALKQITDTAQPMAQIGAHVFYGNPQAAQPTLASRAGLGSGAVNLNHMAGVDTRLIAAADYASQKTGDRYLVPSGEGGTRTQAQADANAKAGIGVTHSLHIADEKGVGHAADIMTVGKDGKPRYASPAFAAAMKEYGQQNGFPVRWGNVPGFIHSPFMGGRDPVHFDLGLNSRLTGVGFSPGAPPTAIAYADTISTDAMTSHIGAGGSLRKGSNGAPVHELQAFLADQGVGDRIGAPLKVDGNFGNRTKEAVKNYQARNGLTPVDGVVGPATLAKINADMTPTSGTGAGMVGSPELAGRNFAAGAAAAAVTVDPVLARAFVPSGKATLTAALEHPNDPLQGPTFDPAAARISDTLRKMALSVGSMEQDKAFAVQKANAGKGLAPPIEAEAGVRIPQSFQDWLGTRPGDPIKEHQAPAETGMVADVQRALNVETWLQAPIVQDSPLNSSSSFSSVTDSYRPSGGGNNYEPGNSGSSFDNFAAGMSHTYQQAASGGSWSQTFFPSSSPTPAYEPDGSNTSVKTDAAGRVLGGI